MSEYTPTTEYVRRCYEVANEKHGLSDDPTEFDRWLAAHDRALREQIAQEIEAHIDDDGTDEWFAAIELAASIARGEEQTDE